MKKEFQTLDFVIDTFIKKARENGDKADLILVLKNIDLIQTTEYRITIYTKNYFQDNIIIKYIDIIRKTILDFGQKYWYLFLNDTPLFYLEIKYNIKGFTPLGFNMETELNYETGTKYDFKGFDYYGINSETKDYFDINGFNMLGFNENGIFQYTGTKYDFYGFDKFCFNEEGIYKYTGTKYSIVGYDKNGKDKKGIFNSNYFFY